MGRVCAVPRHPADEFHAEGAERIAQLDLARGEGRASECHDNRTDTLRRAVMKVTLFKARGTTVVKTLKELSCQVSDSTRPK